MTDQELMLTSILDCRRQDLYTKGLVLSPEEKDLFEKMKSRRAQGEPVQFITGETEFCGLRFLVNSDVLIPRPETEMMVDFIISRMRERHGPEDPIRVLDIGTGSGCIAVSLAKNFPSLMCDAVDISPAALDVAKKNAACHDVAGRIGFYATDIKQFWSQASAHSYDMIISNPPYIPRDYFPELPQEVRWEPGMALDGGTDGLGFYRDFVSHAPEVLKPQGGLVCEFWDGQDHAIGALFNDEWQVDFFEDLSGVNRFLTAYYHPGQ